MCVCVCVCVCVCAKIGNNVKLIGNMNLRTYVHTVVSYVHTVVSYVLTYVCACTAMYVRTYLRTSYDNKTEWNMEWNTG